MANVSGSPRFLALSTNGFNAFGSACTFPLNPFFKLIDWPLRFKIHGMIIGFFGEPSSPIVEAIGMPSSMCVPWMSPAESESRIAAQFAPFETVDSMPYFLNNPFSCAMTIGEQSVSAMIPNFNLLVSGASLAAVDPDQPRGTALSNAPSAEVRATDRQKLLRLIEVLPFFRMRTALAAHVPTGQRKLANLRIASMNGIHSPRCRSVGSPFAKGVFRALLAPTTSSVQLKQQRSLQHGYFQHAYRQPPVARVYGAGAHWQLYRCGEEALSFAIRRQPFHEGTGDRRG